VANKYWAAGVSGNWNSILSWSDFAIGTPAGALVPGAGDAAIFNAASGTVTATLDISPTVQTLTMTGFTGTLAFGTNTISLNSTGTVFQGATTMTVTGTPLIILTNNSATARTLQPATVTEANSISFRITAGTGTLSLGSPSSYRNLDFTDGTNPTGYAGALGTTPVTIYGDFKASTGMSATAAANAFTFAATSGTKTIDTAGVTFDRPFTFNGVGGTFQLAAALTSGATRTCTLTNGTLDLNNFTLTTGLFSTNASNATTLAFGTGNIILSGTGTIFTGSTTTTVTGTPQIIATNSSATARTITPTAVTEANSISFRVTAGTGTLVTTAGAYRNLDFTDGINPTGYAGALQGGIITVYGNFKASTGMTQTPVTNTITFAATSGTKTINTAAVVFDRPFTFNGAGGTFQLVSALTSGATRTCTLTNGTLDLNNLTLTTGIFNSNNSNTRVLAFGSTGKIVLTGTGATVFSLATGTGFTYTGTSRIEAPGPATTGTRVFNPSSVATSTEATALNFYITGGSDTINFSATSRRVNILDFTGFTGTFTNSALTVHGSYTLVAGMTVGSGTEITTFATTTSQNITTNAQTLDFPVTFNGIGGTFQLQDALTLGATQALTLVDGTLQLKSGTTNTVGSFATSGTNQKFLSATTPGSQATLSDASGTNSVSYLTIQDSNATGGAVFQAFTSNFNVDAGNNTGWKFNNAGGSFLMFF